MNDLQQLLCDIRGVTDRYPGEEWHAWLKRTEDIAMDAWDNRILPVSVERHHPKQTRLYKNKNRGL